MHDKIKELLTGVANWDRDYSNSMHKLRAKKILLELESEPKKKYTEKELQNAMDYGAGYVCGIANERLTRNELDEVFVNLKGIMSEKEKLTKTNQN